MRKFFIKLICLFIPSKALRHKLYKFKYSPKQMYLKKIHEVVLRNSYVKFCASPFIVADMIAKTAEEYASDKLALLAGLDRESLNAIMPVLNRYEIFSRNGMGAELPLSYRESEFIQNTADFHKAIKKQRNGTYKYKDFVLPGKWFLYHTFEETDWITNLKNQKIDGDIIDVGCFVGDSVLVFRKHFPNNRIVSFEPTSKIYKEALKTMELNNIENVKIESLALGDSIGEISFGVADSVEASVGNSISFSNIFPKKETVKISTLDQYVLENKIKKVGLIKADIEGAEQLFLKGALKTIKKDKPVLFLSLYHSYSDLFHIKPMVEKWNLGYKIKIKKYSENPFAEIALVCEAD